MNCERCGEQEATIHVTDIQQGKPMEQHLCESCAQTAGIDPKPSMPISELLSSYVLSKQGQEPEEAEQGGAPEGGPTGGAPSIAKCEACGLTFAEFKQSGLLGCPECYSALEEQLGPLISRAHEGATHHVGKVPRRALADSEARGTGGIEDLVGSTQVRAQRMAALRQRLDQAVAAEQYELAARIQEEIRSIGQRQGDPETPEALDQRDADAPRGSEETQRGRDEDNPDRTER